MAELNGLGWPGGVLAALVGLLTLAWARRGRAPLRAPVRSSSTFFPSDLDSLQAMTTKPNFGQSTNLMAAEQRLGPSHGAHTTDAADAGCLTEALERLRAQVQPSVDKLGIHLSWRVEQREEFQALTGPVARQALHIAQEGLANVVQHARASRAEVVCRYVPEHGTLVMEVRDNGRGMHKQHGARAGLKSMRRAAERLGGDLSLASKQGAGTRVRLTLALGPVVKRSFDNTRPWRDDAKCRSHPLGNACPAAAGPV